MTVCVRFGFSSMRRAIKTIVPIVSTQVISR